MTSRRGQRQADPTILHAIARVELMSRLVADPRVLVALAELAEDPGSDRLATLMTALELPAWRWLPGELENAQIAYAIAARTRPHLLQSGRWYAARREGILAEAVTDGTLTGRPDLPAPPDIGAGETAAEARIILAAYRRRLERAVAAVSPAPRRGRRPPQTSIDAAQRDAAWLARHLIDGETVASIAASELPAWSTTDPANVERQVWRGLAHAEELLDVDPSGSALGDPDSKDERIVDFSVSRRRNRPARRMPA